MLGVTNYDFGIRRELSFFDIFIARIVTSHCFLTLRVIVFERIFSGIHVRHCGDPQSRREFM